MKQLVESKLLDLNLSKSVYIVAGNKKARNMLKKKAEESPLILCKTVMKYVEANKYLGCWLAGSAAETVATTVSHRLGVAKRTIYEIRAVIEDRRADTLGAVEIALRLWEQTVIPMLLFGADTWSLVPKKTMDQLDKVSHQFLKSVLGLGKNGCPTPILYLQTATMTMSNRIL